MNKSWLFLSRQLLDELLPHHLSYQLFALSQSILESIEEIEEEIADVILLVYWYLLAIIVDDAFQYSRWVPVLLIGGKYLDELALHAQHDVLRG